MPISWKRQGNGQFAQIGGMDKTRLPKGDTWDQGKGVKGTSGEMVAAVEDGLETTALTIITIIFFILFCRSPELCQPRRGRSRASGTILKFSADSNPDKSWNSLLWHPLAPARAVPLSENKSAPSPADTDQTKSTVNPTLDILVFLFTSLNSSSSSSSSSLPPSSMLLARNPVPFPMSPPTVHRRHPSAPPAVVVQPTKVPGILSISKPLRAESPRQHQLQSHTRHPHRSPRPKHVQPRSQPAQDEPGKPAQEKLPSDVTLPPVVEKPSAQPPAPLPDKSPRGRQTKVPKDKGATR